MKRVTKGVIGVTSGVSLLLLSGCGLMGSSDKENKPIESPAEQMQGVAMKPNHQIQRYLATRWGNEGRGGAAERQPGYIHVLLGEEDPQGAEPWSYDMALTIRESMNRRAQEMAQTRLNQQEAQRMREIEKDQAIELLIRSAEVEANRDRQVQKAKDDALDKSRERERKRFNSTSEEMGAKMGAMNTLMQEDRWRIACAGYHDLLDEGDYRNLINDGFRSGMIPSNCSGLYPTEAFVRNMLIDECPAKSGQPAKAEFFRKLFKIRGINTQLYSDSGNAASECL